MPPQSRKVVFTKTRDAAGLPVPARLLDTREPTSSGWSAVFYRSAATDNPAGVLETLELNAGAQLTDEIRTFFRSETTERARILAKPRLTPRKTMSNEKQALLEALDARQRLPIVESAIREEREARAKLESTLTVMKTAAAKAADSGYFQGPNAELRKVAAAIEASYPRLVGLVLAGTGSGEAHSDKANLNPVNAF